MAAWIGSAYDRPIMQKLIDGVHRFRNEDIGKYRELFHRLAHDGQDPHSLFITCSDSRVLAELITHSQPGDLFVVKNVGNIVPPADAAGTLNSTAAAIEFAVSALRVTDVVVCGHTQCGAMRALLDDDKKSTELPHLHRWLELAEPVRQTILRDYAHLTDPVDRATAAAEENVLLALENLRSYGCVQRRLTEGSLYLHGWMFKIRTAELFAFDPQTRQFTILEEPRDVARPEE